MLRRSAIIRMGPVWDAALRRRFARRFSANQVPAVVLAAKLVTQAIGAVRVLPWHCALWKTWMDGVITASRFGEKQSCLLCSKARGSLSHWPLYLFIQNLFKALVGYAPHDHWMLFGFHTAQQPPAAAAHARALDAVLCAHAAARHGPRPLPAAPARLQQLLLSVTKQVAPKKKPRPPPKERCRRRAVGPASATSSPGPPSSSTTSTTASASSPSEHSRSRVHSGECLAAEVRRDAEAGKDTPVSRFAWGVTSDAGDLQG